MRPFFLLILSLLLLAGCLEQAAPTPVEIQQYPATWTPAPTGTPTPYPATATLVIRRTPGALPTRDPNARILPTVPRNRFGQWANVSSETPNILDTLLARANIIVTDGTGNVARGNDAAVFLRGDTAAFTTAGSLAAQYNGIVVPPASEAQLAAVRTAIAPRLVLVSVPIPEIEEVSRVSDVIDGVQLEEFLIAPNAPLTQFPSEDDWKRDVDALVNFSNSTAYAVLVQTRLGESTTEDALLVEQWLNFSLATFLVGVNGTHGFFNFESVSAPQTADSPLMNVDLGTPVSVTFKQNGVYQRRFTRGLVLVNPAAEPHAFALSRNFVDVNGTRIDQVNMPPHSGMILLNTE